MVVEGVGGGSGSLPPATAEGALGLILYIYMGESNGKLPPRTCPGCSVPEPYRSHDWALVPAKPGLHG